MARELRLDWEEFDQSISPTLTSRWASMSTAPYQENGQWVSVFLLPETSGESHDLSRLEMLNTHLAMSLSAKLKQLMLLEKESIGDPRAVIFPGSAEWIAEGMDIELVQ
jgi:hypothetical protein